MKKPEAAALLGMPESEILGLVDDDAGTIITTFDHQSYIVVPEDHPDVDGKTGLMFLAAPSEHYAGGLPVFAQPTEDSPPERVTEVVPPPKPPRKLAGSATKKPRKAAAGAKPEADA